MLTGEADVVAEDAAGDGGDEAGEDDDAGDLAGVRLVPRGVVKSNSHCSKTRSGNKRSKLPTKQDLSDVHVAYPGAAELEGYPGGARALRLQRREVQPRRRGSGGSRGTRAPQPAATDGIGLRLNRTESN